MKFVVIFSCLLGLSVAESSSNTVQLEFRNKNMNVKFPIVFEALTPSGLRILVPAKEGIDFFAFHGKINLPIRKGEEGIEKWEKIRPEGTIIKEFPDVQLLVGDVINFWTRIQQNGVSLQTESLSHIVKELTPGPFPVSELPAQTQEETPTSRPTTVAPNRSAPSKKQSRTTTTSQPLVYAPAPAAAIQNCECINGMLQDVWTQMNATAGRMSMIEENYTPLEDKINSLTETVDELIKNMNIGTKLLLTGNLPVRSNPVEDVRHLLIEKLKLQDLSTSILQAEYQSNGIVFEVASSIDKLRILKRSKDILAKLSYQIVDPEKAPVLDVRSDE